MNARTFAKICHNAPCIVLNEAVKQLRIYNNIIPSISASLANYSLTLSVEISIFMILRHLSEIGKGIIREDEGLIESWMQNCSNFISLTIKKHHRIDLTGIFVFIANRLASDSDKESVFVVLFKDIITRMSGYESVSSFTQTQLSSLSGGIGLKTEAFGLFEQVRTAKKSSNSLADFLKSQNNHVRVFCDNDVEYTLSLPVYLIILMSRMRDKLVYKSDLSKPTLINMLFDMINESLVQFGLFLSSYPEFFTNRCQLLPDNPWEVMTNLKVSPEIAYQILRYSFKPIYKLEETEWSEVVQKFKSSFDDFPYKTQYIAASVENDKISSYAEGERAKMWQMMSPELFTLFWYLDSEHLFVPQDAYNTQIADLLKESKSDSKSDKNLDRAKKNIEALKQEMSSKLVEKEKLDRYLQGKKDQLIGNFFNSDINIHFYQHCILPRIRLSPSDAIYCVKFINTIMQLKEISPIDQLEIRFNTVKYLYPTVLACSEFEAFNMGIFTEEILDITSNLNDNAKLYSDFKGGKKYDKSQQAEVSKIRYSILVNYKSLCEVFEASFKDSTFMQARRLLILFDRIVSVYPSTKELANYMLEVVRKRVPDSDQKGSLELLAQSYKNKLEKCIQDLPDYDLKELKSQVEKAKKIKADMKDEHDSMSPSKAHDKKDHGKPGSTPQQKKPLKNNSQPYNPGSNSQAAGQQSHNYSNQQNSSYANQGSGNSNYRKDNPAQNNPKKTGYMDNRDNRDNRDTRDSRDNRDRDNNRADRDKGYDTSRNKKYATKKRESSSKSRRRDDKPYLDKRKEPKDYEGGFDKGDKRVKGNNYDRYNNGQN